MHTEKYTYEIDCVYKCVLINQGLKYCIIGYDVDHCVTCPHRKPETVECTVTSTQTK